MSAAHHPASSVTLADERRAHEPSMEEILASIRRIIADDDRLHPLRRDRGGEASDALAAPPEPEDEPVIQPRAYPRPVLKNKWPSQARALEPEPEPPVMRETAEPEAPAEQPAAPIELRTTSAEFYALQPLLADDAEEATTEAELHDQETPTFAAEPASDFEDLESDKVVALQPAAQNSLVSDDAAASISAHFQALAASTILSDSGMLRDYAKDLLRPMLKQWLDDNLPVMVEKLVRAEIERVARGRR